MKRMRCDADIIGRHRLNLPPEPPDMRRDSGGFVVSLCPEFTQGRVTPSPSNDETELKRRRHPILTNSTATRTQIQFFNPAEAFGYKSGCQVEIFLWAALPTVYVQHFVLLKGFRSPDRGALISAIESS
ncbi:hypothetical protein PGTUg99_002086 [Puccinia graminis f. sp. tritici]|uniref:Uncharacterized protein n=1 Tax=Puccinia graminis f. sp. tritici TaxID=56615 RepID=A0A5B0SGT6_PUCGR|nr:hypothetical protein PGTUg99_002086 [Puccinia graminis f. sp. tritici]